MEIDLEHFRAWMKRDFIYIVMMCLAIIGCLYTMATVGDYQQKCNEHWEHQMTIGKCVCTESYQFNATPTLPLTDIEINFNNGNKDKG